jgi:membrane fusion protein (multidrug efflux system)
MIFPDSSRFVLVAVVAVSALGVIGCSDKKEQAAAVTSVEAPLELLAADVAVARRGVLAGGLPVTGTLQAVNQTTVQARVGSDITAVLVREGEIVQKGQVLARLGTQDLEARVKQAEAQLATARVEAQLTRALLERNRKLFEKNYFSENDFARSQGEAEARDEAVRAQQAMVDISRKALKDAVVVAPMKGVVARRYVEPGSSVMMESKLFDIVDLGQMELQASVPAAEVPRIRVGQSVLFSVDGFGGRRFQGQVSRINPVADAATRAITVYVRVNNPDAALKGGMFARGEITSGSGKESLIVPMTALRQGGKSTTVFVLKNGRLELRQVGVEGVDQRAGEAVVSVGVAEGETVVVASLNDQAANRAAKVVGLGQ